MGAKKSKCFTRSGGLVAEGIRKHFTFPALAYILLILDMQRYHLCQECKTRKTHIVD